jgi:hypothetical protein
VPYNAKTPLLEIIYQASGVIFILVKISPDFCWNKLCPEWTIIKVQHIDKVEV